MMKEKSFANKVTCAFLIVIFNMSCSLLGGIISAFCGLGSFYVFHISLGLSPVRAIMISNVITCMIMYYWVAFDLNFYKGLKERIEYKYGD